MIYKTLREANIARNKEWDSEGQINIEFRGLEFAGETGEVCNIVKKLARERMGLKGSRATVPELAMELADAMITMDLIAMEFDIDLNIAVEEAFNAKSIEHGFKTQLHMGETNAG